MVAESSELLLGIDLGAVNLKVALHSASGLPLRKICLPARGRPLLALSHAFDEVMQGHPPEAALRVGVTGSGQKLLLDLVPAVTVNEIMAIARAASDLPHRPRTIIDLGGQISKWILAGGESDPPGTVLDLATNGLCAAGAGAFLEQQACRLSLSVDSLGQMAASAARGASIAGRCSVFAKSDMIHLQQKGTPTDEIALGLCQAMVRTFLSTVMQGRKPELPVMLVGGGAINPGLIRAFREVLRLQDGQFMVPPDPLYFGAIGAARMASMAQVLNNDRLRLALRERLQSPSHSSADAVVFLPPLAPSSFEDSGRPQEDPAPPDGNVKAWLGIDVGSVSTNLVLLDPDFSILQGIYLPTSGRPIEVLREGMRLIWERFGERLSILGVGSTGSGRHLAAKMLGADAVRNEITAQMVSSAWFVPEVDTIFEIGGQDSKYISVKSGQLADFEMNKICAGGTGSFLEEQAQRLGVNIYGEFAQLALAASHPCDLGTRCTVYMDSELVRAQERGVLVENLCAGLAYSVARNYLEKVVAGRPIGDHIIIQGGTASNTAVVAAFRQILNRPVRVHPYNRISGAIGAALLAARVKRPVSRFLGFRPADHVAQHSFECRRCDNRCQVSRVHVGERVIHFGDVCERFSERDHDDACVSRWFPELFAAREQLLERHLSSPGGEAPGTRRMGLLRASLNLEFLPLWTIFLRELGYMPVLSRRITSAQLQENWRGVPAEVCLPLKSAAAHARGMLAAGEVDRIFLPTLLECPPRAKDEPSHTCFYVQALADMLRVELKDQLVSAQFVLKDGIMGLVEPVRALAEALKRPADEVLSALMKARARQSLYAADRDKLGKEALSTSFERAVVVLGRPYNTHDPLLNLFLAKQVERLGLHAIPWDLLPLDCVQLDQRFQTVPWHFSREQLRAIELIRRDSRLFPILISSYGCGPDGFIMKHAEEMLADRPRLLLEFDEHRGEAGLVTRLEAFADEIEEHLRTRKRVALRIRPTPGPNRLPEGRRFFIPSFLEQARIYAAVLQSAGFEAQILPAPDKETIRLGEENSSGRECHPYAIIAGELVRFVREASLGDGDVFLIPNCSAPCLVRQYGDGYRILLRGLESPKIEVWEASSEQMGDLVGIPGLMRLYEGILATDILLTLGTRLRPYEQQAGHIDCMLVAALEKLARAVREREGIDDVLVRLAVSLWKAPRTAKPGTLPVVGVTGDLYTRMNPAGNAGLFRRLEQMGCEVWPSPFFATLTDLVAALNFHNETGRVQIKDAALDGLTWALVSGVRYRLVRRLSEEIVRVSVEPPVDELIRLAQPYVGPRTSYLILQVVAKAVDFLRRGAAGVISAAGINCMVGTAASSFLAAVRADFRQAPALALFYGGAEGPAQRIRLETFVHQVRQRWQRPAA
jgi:predicted CoA-substrate-specific enzyme activase